MQRTKEVGVKGGVEFSIKVVKLDLCAAKLWICTCFFPPTSLSQSVQINQQTQIHACHAYFVSFKKGIENFKVLFVGCETTDWELSSPLLYLVTLGSSSTVTLSASQGKRPYANR